MSTKDINTIKLGGAKRKNGHKLNCSCHICENINNKAKRGGYEEDAEKEELKRMGGSKKKNGHKPDCTCPICKNMRNSRKRYNKKTKKQKFYKGGDEDYTIEDENELEMQNAGSKKRKTMRKRLLYKGGDDEPESISVDNESVTKDSNEENATSEDYDNLEQITGGKKSKNKTRKINGHKMICKCPICKNMKCKKHNKK